MRPRILAALDRAGIPHRAAYVSSHTSGVLSAVDTGFCLTALVGSTVPAHFRRLGVEDGLPTLPPAEVAMLVPARPTQAAERLASAIRTAFASR